MASAVRLITSAALKVLNTTEAAIESQHGEPTFHPPLEENDVEFTSYHGNDSTNVSFDEIDSNEYDVSESLSNKLTEQDLCRKSADEELWIDADNQVFQSKFLRYDDGELICVEKDKNANAVCLSPSTDICKGTCGKAMCKCGQYLRARSNDGQLESPHLEESGHSDCYESRVVSSPRSRKSRRGDSKEKKVLSKKPLTLTLPTKQSQSPDQKKKREGSKDATPDSASAKPKSPEATVSPGSRQTYSPSSGPILHLTSGSTSPPTATLLFSSDDQIWEYPEQAVQGSASDSDLPLPSETAPDEGKDTKEDSRIGTFGKNLEKY